jgi:hypothetical protein
MERTQKNQVLGIFVLAIFAIFGVLLGPTIIGAAAGVDAQINCFIGAVSLNAVIPFVYYGGIAMLMVGGVTFLLKGAANRSMMAFTRGHWKRPMGAAITATAMLAMVVGVLSLGSFAPWGMKGQGSLYAAETTCLLLDGTTVMTGNLQMGGNDITGNGSITSSGTSTAAAFVGDQVSTGLLVATGDIVVEPAGSDVIFQDAINLAFGTGRDSVVSYDGTDTFWDLRQAGAGDLIIALETGFPSPDPNAVHIWSGSAGSVTAHGNSKLIIEDDGTAFLGFVVPDDENSGLISYSPVQPTDRGWLQYGHSAAAVPASWILGISNTDRLFYSAGAFEFQEATTISTTAGSLTLNPATTVDVASDPLIIQSADAGSSPGTTYDGQIRLWRDSGASAPEGRILAQVAGTTYQWNADAGLTFANRPAQYAADKTRFGTELATWRTNLLGKLLTEYLTFFGANGLTLSSAVTREATWSDGWFDALRSSYRSIASQLPGNVRAPKTGTMGSYNAHQPVPNPADYRVADASRDETISARTGAQLALGDAVVLQVDRVNTVGGTTMSIHAVPSSLEDEFINLLATDTAFRNRVQDLLGISRN